MKGGVVVVVMVLAAILAWQRGQAISCGQVDVSLLPCLSYLTGGTCPSPACCAGVKNLKAMTPTTDGRRAACRCIKQVASRYAGIKPEKATQLPRDCGVEISVPITKDIDCSKIP